MQLANISVGVQSRPTQSIFWSLHVFATIRNFFIVLIIIKSINILTVFISSYDIHRLNSSVTHSLQAKYKITGSRCCCGRSFVPAWKSWLLADAVDGYLVS
ncbi:hypothetical protein P168DRAFT_75054 [Aspergillus campestris IBT 28561]|uniref:Uncharacterized protein n=1 Tax=Aspergillus campestris (strain IBT 28561) TaxID=1392248 RepID=A0A2I1CRL5_ASPC2|nr:uncharacterized protein P168DRAFT_75054 [Aspergillus campestris IBT 28561]PKY00260.1 hypothetical protein P168DRAFT_75054 [Aspergillus campestris IBT 28561]